MSIEIILVLCKLNTKNEEQAFSYAQQKGVKIKSCLQRGIDNFLMQAQIRNYNFLIVGKSGAGKSATTRLLTGNPEITVANSLKQVTTQARFYQGASFHLNNAFVKFRILDIPGLDKMNNRFIIREQILKILEREKIVLHGILYVSSLTERDTVDSEKLFNFIQQLPWSREVKKNCLIPIFTKYDNLIIDSLDEEIRSTKQQYKQIFEKAGYSAAWSKRVYWINHTKSLDFKMKTYEEIKITHEKQVQRLVEMIHRSKSVLTADDIMSTIKLQEKFILQNLFHKMQMAKLPYKIENKRYTLKATLQIEQKHFQESVTVLSASSIAIFIAKVLQKEIPTIYSVALMSLPIAIALLTMKETSSVLHGKKVSEESSGVELLQAYERLCHLINLEVQNEWKELNHMIELRAIDDYLYCHIVAGHKKFKFIDLTNLKISMDEDYFESLEKKNTVDFSNESNENIPTDKLTNENIKKQFQHINKKFRIKIPKFDTETIWEPSILFQYGVRIFDQNSILKQIETLRQDYYNNLNQGQ